MCEKKKNDPSKLKKVLIHFITLMGLSFYFAGILIRKKICSLDKSYN